MAKPESDVDSLVEVFRPHPALSAIGVVLGAALLWVIYREFGFWNWMVIQFTWAVRFFIGVGLALAFSYALFLLVVEFLRLGKPKVIDVSVVYQGRLIDVARAVVTAIVTHGIRAHTLDLSPREHDTVIDEVQARIDGADAIVAIPSCDRGFFESEARRGPSFRLPTTPLLQSAGLPLV